MCCRKDVVMRLCDLYPDTAEVVKDNAMCKRQLYLHFLKDVDEKESGVPSALDSKRIEKKLNQIKPSEEHKKVELQLGI